MRNGKSGATGISTAAIPSRRRARRSPLLERIDAFLRELKPEASDIEAQYVGEMMLSAIRLIDDRASLADMKLLNASLRELRYAFRVFARYRDTRKVTTFGSARTPQGHPEYQQARHFSERIADEGFMVITGAGGGVMRACQEGAGRERSFGVNIRLPFEQVANEFIAGDPKLVNFKYFFTRKLLFVKEADAIVFFPGGFGTHDEAYESLTLVQTGKTLLVPLVFIDAPGGHFWKDWEESIRRVLLAQGLISEEDLSVFRVTDDVEEAVSQVRGFYRVYHSSRFVGDKLVLRLNQVPAPEVIERLNHDFADVVLRGQILLRGAFPEERGDRTESLPRLAFHFNRVSYGRLRQMIDLLNRIA